MIQQNIARIESLVQEIKSHPLALDVKFDSSQILVIYPSGYFPDGVRGRFNNDKIVILTKVLNAMEQHWKDSFPCALPIQ